MSSYLMTPQATRLKLVPQIPMPGESISSLIDRQAQFWGVFRKELVHQAACINGMLALRDLDVCKKGDFLDIYAQKTGIDREMLEVLRAKRPEMLIRPTWRHAYCPICFFEDASAGHTPYFRLDWARIFLTHCRRHECPLFRWPRVSPDGTRKLPHGWFVGEGPDLRALPQFRRDLMLAKAYAYGIRPKRPESRMIWNTLKCFEARLYELGVGAPNHLIDDARCRSIEYEAMRKIFTLAQFVTANGRLQTDESSVLSFGDPRVMSYAFKTARVHPSNPPRIGLRPGVQSIACRRAVLVSLCKDIEFRGLGRDSSNNHGQATTLREGAA